jgi:mxaJ protein
MCSAFRTDRGSLLSFSRIRERELGRFMGIAAFLIALLSCSGLVQARDFKVCAEPNNLPYSNRDGGGYENRIAQLLAQELQARLVLVPIAQNGPGFIRATLGRGRCDALLAMPVGNDQAAVTAPYYRSGWVFVTRAQQQLDLRSFDDPRLRDLRIGVPVVGEGSDTPALIALGVRGLVQHLHAYSIGGDTGSGDDASAQMIADVAAGRIDVALAWGPAAGYHAARQREPLRLSPAPDSDRGIPLALAIGVAVQRQNTALRDELDRALQRRRGDIAAILAEYHVPRLDGAAAVARREPQ